MEVHSRTEYLVLALAWAFGHMAKMCILCTPGSQWTKLKISIEYPGS